MKNKLANSAKSAIFGPSTDPVYICLPYKGIAAERITQNLRTAVQSTYGAVYYLSNQSHATKCL